jgi:hypothetical protein
MKQFLFTSLAVLVTATLAISLGSCAKEKNPGGGSSRNQLQTSYFSIEDASYVDGAIPAATTEEEFSDVNINNNVLRGGTSIITVSSPAALDKLYVGVAGITGYYTLPAAPVQLTRAEGDYVYEFTINVSQNLAGDFTVVVTALTEDGEVMPEFTHEFGLIEAGTGALQVSLSFNNAKDVDLYVVLPDEKIIYYANPGRLDYFNEETYEYSMLWGLDVDSNAGCDIDNINNENVFFPTEYVMNGTYEVYVNMFANCDESIATSWVVTTIYNGNPINVDNGENPAHGTFPVGAESTYGDDEILTDERENGLEDFIKAMEFTISGAALNPGELDYGDDGRDYTRALQTRGKAAKR